MIKKFKISKNFGITNRATIWLGLIWLYLIASFTLNFSGHLFAEEIIEEYDVIVVGSDPEGIAAAVAAARKNVKTLLLDVNNRLGGLWVNGWLNVLDLNLDEDNNPLNVGLFDEIFTKIGRNNAFDVAQMKDVLMGIIMAEPWLTFRQNIYLVRPIVNGKAKKLYKPGQTIFSDDLYLYLKNLSQSNFLLMPDVCKQRLDNTYTSRKLCITSDKGFIVDRNLVEDWLCIDEGIDEGEVKKDDISKSYSIKSDNNVLSPSAKVLPSVEAKKGKLSQNEFEANTITGVEVVDYNGFVKKYKAKVVIDATQDADIVVAAGGSYRYWGEDVWFMPRNMAVTLVFKLKGLSLEDWENLRSYVKKIRGKHEGQNKTSIWGFYDITKQYKPTNNRINLRGLNLGLQKDNSVLVNAVHVFGVDPLNPSSRLEAKNLVKQELASIVEFLKSQIPPLKKVTSIETAPELYVRSSRQIITHYILTVDDVLENKDFEDKIAYGSYPLDVQAVDRSYLGDIIGKPIRYAIPIRCIIPKGFNNLLIVGRSAGFDSLAHSSARTVPVGIALGQAAGVLAAFCVKNSYNCLEVMKDIELVTKIQAALKEQNVKLDYKKLPLPKIAKHWAYEGLKFWRRRAEASGGYENDYNLDENVTIKALINRLRSFTNEFSQKKIYNISSDVLVSFFKNLEQFSNLKLEFGSFLIILDLFESVLESKLGEYEIKQSRMNKFLQNLMVKEDLTRKLIQRFENYGLFKEPYSLKLDKVPISSSYISRGALYLLLKRWYDYKLEMYNQHTNKFQ